MTQEYLERFTGLLEKERRIDSRFTYLKVLEKAIDKNVKDLEAVTIRNPSTGSCLIGDTELLATNSWLVTEYNQELATAKKQSRHLVKEWQALGREMVQSENDSVTWLGQQIFKEFPVKVVSMKRR